MPQTTEKPGSTHLEIMYVNQVNRASRLANFLVGASEIKDSPLQLQEAISTFFSALENLSFAHPAAVYVISTPIHRKLRLHKNTYITTIMLSIIPTNNNTHTPSEEAVTP